METLENLNPTAYAIMDCVIEGLSGREIADKLGLSEYYISTIKGGPQFQHQLAIRRARYSEKHDDEVARKAVQANDVLRQHAAEAAQNLVNLMNADSDSIKLRAAEGVLDRTGSPRQGGAQVQVANITINEGDAALIKETLDMTKGDEK